MQKQLVKNGTEPVSVGKVLENIDPPEEQISPFLDTESLFPPVQRHDLANGRFYTPVKEWWEDNYKDRPIPFFPSSTTTLHHIGKGIGWDMWLGDSLSYKHAMEYSKEASEKGTVLHEMYRELILGNVIERENNWFDVVNMCPVDITDSMIKHLMGFKAFWTEYGLTLDDVLACEVAMIDLTPKGIAYPGKDTNRPWNRGAYDYKYSWAGTADLITYIVDPKTKKRELWLIDFKTGKEYSLEHHLQLISYAMLFNATSPDKVERIGCLYTKDGWRKKPTWTLREHSFDARLWYSSLRFWKLWAKNNNRLDPKFPMELPTSINLYNEDYDEQDK